jgi:3-deoxy-manno-octulosonate cytidylyltransferase (CMP-KDO synthetase)
MSLKPVIIIPSRIGSTRLKNKPLVDLNGKSLIQRVFENAISIVKDVYIATDSVEIFDHISLFTDNIVMTSKDHISGTDRVYEAAEILKIDNDRLIINLQGDEPFMPASIVNNLITQYKKHDCDVITSAHLIDDSSLVNNYNCVKAIINEDSFADDFLREVDANKYDLFYQHVGIYGYSLRTLKELINLEPTQNELSRSLEQLRFLDNGYKIFISITEEVIPPGIDTQDDVNRAINFITNDS